MGRTANLISDPHTRKHIGAIHRASEPNTRRRTTRSFPQVVGCLRLPNIPCPALSSRRPARLGYLYQTAAAKQLAMTILSVLNQLAFDIRTAATPGHDPTPVPRAKLIDWANQLDTIANSIPAVSEQTPEQQPSSYMDGVFVTTVRVDARAMAWAYFQEGMVCASPSIRDRHRAAAVSFTQLWDKYGPGLGSNVAAPELDPVRTSELPNKDHILSDCRSAIEYLGQRGNYSEAYREDVVNPLLARLTYLINAGTTPGG